jgi:hypothetical protein
MVDIWQQAYAILEQDYLKLFRLENWSDTNRPETLQSLRVMSIYISDIKNQMENYQAAQCAQDDNLSKLFAELIESKLFTALEYSTKHVAKLSS